MLVVSKLFLLSPSEPKERTVGQHNLYHVEATLALTVMEFCSRLELVDNCLSGTFVRAAQEDNASIIVTDIMTSLLVEIG